MLSNAFLLDQRHRSFIKTGTGKLQASLRDGLWLFVGILLLGIGLIRIDLTQTAIEDWRILEERGVVETFVVNSVSEERVFPNTQVYEVVFEGSFPDGGAFRATRTTDNYDRSFNETGSEVVRVIYDPPLESGSISRMEIESGFGFPLREVAITALFIVGGAGLSLYGIYRMVRYVQIQRQGELIPGKIMDVVKIHADQRVNFVIHYVFESPDSGTMLEGRATHSRRQLENRPLPRKGASVAVLYRNDHQFEVL